MSRPSFSRHGGKFKPQAKVLVLCEDTKSAKDYLEDAAVWFRARVEVEIIHFDTSPRNTVEEALKRHAAFEQVYCVIDRDQHETFEEARRMLKAAQVAGKVKLIVSWPCYEFWLVLHFGYTRSAYQGQGGKSPAAMVMADLRKKEGMQQYAKGKSDEIFSRLGPARLAQARKNAVRAMDDAVITGEFNPSTEIHLLIDCFESLGTLQPA